MSETFRLFEEFFNHLWVYMPVNAKVLLGYCLFLLLLFLGIFIFKNQSENLHYQDRQTLRYIQINKLLHQFRRECIAKNYDAADNTFLDIRQEWALLDIENAVRKQPNNFTTDSLRILDSLITSFQVTNGDKYVTGKLIEEINRVNSKLDKTAPTKKGQPHQ